MTTKSLRAADLARGFLEADIIISCSRNAGLLELEASDGEVVLLPQALRPALAARLADACSAEDRRRFSARAAAYQARELGRDILSDLTLRHEAAEIVYAPRDWNHVRDMLAIDRRLATRGRPRSWFVFTSAMRSMLAGRPLVSGRNVRCGLTSAARLRREAGAVSARVRAARWGRGRMGDDDRLIDVAEEVLRENAFTVAAAFHAADEALSSKTRLVVVGNPRTAEGHVVASVARARGIGVACLQHGLEVSRDQAWREAPVDLVCAWGEAGARAIRDSGVPAEAIVVTGAAWTDGIVRGNHVRARQVLVALSGAGHRVGMDEHLSHLDRLFACAARMGDVRFRFRLHPKDDVTLYRARAAGRANVAITESGSGIDIHSQLAESAALITATSTSALDAMLHSVPVISLDREAGEDVPDYVSAGATYRVPPTDQIDSFVTRVLEDEPSAAMRERVASCLSETWGQLDGKASARIADELDRRFLRGARA